MIEEKKGNGVSEEERRQCNEKIKQSDYVIENNSTELELFKNIDQIIEKII